MTALQPGCGGRKRAAQRRKKYLRDAAAFAAFAAGREITKELTAAEYERLLAAAGDSRRCSARARCVSSFCPAPSAAFCGGI